MPDFTSETLYKFTSQNKDVLSDLDQINHKLNEQGSGVSRLGSQLKTLAVTFLSVAAAQRALDLSGMAEKLENARARFNSFFRDAVEGARKLQEARAAVGGTVDNLKLMQDVIKGFDVGRSFDEILTILEFARFRARDTGEEFSALFDQINRALVQGSEAGGGVSLRRFLGIEAQGKEAAEIIALLDSRNRQLRDSTDAASEAMAQFGANIQNGKLILGGFLSAVLSPAISAFNLLFDTLQQRAGLTQATLKLLQSDQGGGGRFVQTEQSLENILRLIQTLDPVEQEKAINTLIADLVLYSTTEEQALQQTLKLREVEEKLLRESGAAYGDIQKNLLQQKAIRQQLTNVATQQSAAAKQQSAEELAARRKSLADERNLVKSKIAVGEETYETLRNILDRQYRDNKDFFESDLEALIAYNTDRAALYAEDANKRNNAQAEVLNATRRYSDALMRDTDRTELQRLAARVDTWQKTLELEDLTLEKRREAYTELQRAEDDLSNYMQAKLNERVAFLQQTFGTAFMDAFSDILDGSTKRFEDYLADLGKLILKFLASRALTSFFFALASGPLAGLFGGGSAGGPVGGGFRGGGGILSAPPTNLIPSGGSILRAAAGAQRFNPSFNPSFTTSVNPAPVYVQIVATPEGLAATVRQGEKGLKRTDYF